MALPETCLFNNRWCEEGERKISLTGFGFGRFMGQGTYFTLLLFFRS